MRPGLVDGLDLQVPAHPHQSQCKQTTPFEILGGVTLHTLLYVTCQVVYKRVAPYHGSSGCTWGSLGPYLGCLYGNVCNNY